MNKTERERIKDPNIIKQANGITKFLLKQGVKTHLHNTLCKEFLLDCGMSKRGIRASSQSLRIQLVQNRFHDFCGFIQSWKAKNTKEKTND